MLAMIHAMPIVNKDYYLDFGCGTGYGTELIGTYFKYPYGIERNQKALAYAKERHTRSGGLFFPSIEATGLKNPRFDFITCIEVIEHMDKAEAEVLVKSLASMLMVEGSIVFTTPKAISATPDNQYHKHEYTMEEFEHFLDRHFNIVEVQDISMGLPNMIAICREPK